MNEPKIKKNIHLLISFLNKDFHPYNFITLLLNTFDFNEVDKSKFKKIFTHDISSKITETNLKQERINSFCTQENALPINCMHVCHFFQR